VTRRWVRFDLPVMVCVDIDDDIEHEQVTTIVLGTEHDDITPARDTDGNDLIYDADMQRVSHDTQDARTALSVATDRAGWPARNDWEEGPDALRDPWLYEAGDIDDEDDTTADDDLEPLDIDGTPDEAPDRRD
jgi:hypothetical protein